MRENTLAGVAKQQEKTTVVRGRGTGLRLLRLGAVYSQTPDILFVRAKHFTYFRSSQFLLTVSSVSEDMLSRYST